MFKFKGHSAKLPSADVFCHSWTFLCLEAKTSDVEFLWKGFQNGCAEVLTRPCPADSTKSTVKALWQPKHLETVQKPFSQSACTRKVYILSSHFLRTLEPNIGGENLSQAWTSLKCLFGGGGHGSKMVWSLKSRWFLSFFFSIDAEGRGCCCRLNLAGGLFARLELKKFLDV